MEKVLKYAFRITHIDNILHILKNGLVKADSPLHDENYVPIGDPQIIGLRGDIEVKGYRIGDYIPFYLGPRSPMLYVIQHGYNGVQRVEPEKIVYCVIRLDDLINNNIDCIFTDGHAVSFLTSFYSRDKLSSINEIVKFDDVYSSQWNSEEDLDLKRRKEAELLIKNDLPVQFLRGFVVYNNEAKDFLIEKGVADNMIAVMPSYYF
ncbi:MAG: DUF4433 domain-containing protein [Bacteroidales bacterium]|nr:DUF4433 domain-containing protein [Bacteroidales bacterium]